MKKIEKDSLTLKWGTLKAWNIHTKKAQNILQKWASLGHNLGAAQQQDTSEQKELICKLIDSVDCEKIWNGWTGKKMTKKQAKKYVLEY